MVCMVYLHRCMWCIRRLRRHQAQPLPLQCSRTANTHTRTCRTHTAPFNSKVLERLPFAHIFFRSHCRRCRTAGCVCGTNVRVSKSCLAFVFHFLYVRDWMGEGRWRGEPEQKECVECAQAMPTLLRACHYSELSWMKRMRARHRRIKWMI